MMPRSEALLFFARVPLSDAMLNLRCLTSATHPQIVSHIAGIRQTTPLIL